jgi:hypothetical protein
MALAIPLVATSPKSPGKKVSGKLNTCSVFKAIIVPTLKTPAIRNFILNIDPLEKTDGSS